MEINRTRSPLPFSLPVLTVLGCCLLSGCVAPTQHPARPAPVAPARPVPPRAPSASVGMSPVTAQDWRDVPLPAGDWSWQGGSKGSTAHYGLSGRTPLAFLQCDRARQTVSLALTVAGPVDPVAHPATITTSTTTGTVAATAAPMEGVTAMTIVFPANSRLLDAMAFSRGRFRVEIAGMTPTILPAWSEVGRVIEDCRG